MFYLCVFFFSSRRRHTRCRSDWSSDVCSSDLTYQAYRAALSAFVALPILYDCGDDHNHYFKFNLDSINLYNLIRLEERTSPFLRSYLTAYSVLWNTTQTHQNAHFNMINRAIQGEDLVRDQQTVQLLNQWLQRPRRDA